MHYTRGDDWSTYPHDRVCVMWNMRRVVPHHIKIVHSSITLWQPIEFKTFPQSCFICRSDTHIAHQCPRCSIKVEALESDPIQKSDPKGKQAQTKEQLSESNNEESANIKELAKVLIEGTESNQ